MKLVKKFLILFPSLLWALIWTRFFLIFRKHYSKAYIYNKEIKLMSKTVRVLGIEYIYRGKENIPNTPSYLLSPNHLTMLDPMGILYENKDIVSFVGKDSIKKVPLLHEYFELLDCKYIERDNLRQEIKLMKDMAEEMTYKNIRYGIFAEGTRNKTNEDLLPFKPGAYKFAMNKGLPIVPVCIYGHKDVLNPKDHRKKYPVYVSYLKPLYKEDYENLTTQEVATIVMERIREELQVVKNLLN